MLPFKVIQEPIEPISLADVKNYLRTIPDDTSEDDGIIRPLMTAAHEFIENATGRALAVQTLQVTLPSFPSTPIRLPRTPFIDVVSVTYTTVDGETHIVDANNYYVGGNDGTIYFPSPPTDELFPIDPVKITYRCGYESMPFPLRQAVLMVIGHWYVNREGVQIGSRINEVAADFALQNIIHQYREWWF